MAHSIDPSLNILTFSYSFNKDSSAVPFGAFTLNFFGHLASSILSRRPSRVYSPSI